MTTKRYIVTAGGALLGRFGGPKKAREYVAAVLDKSHPNIGDVKLERAPKDFIGDPVLVENFGPPTGAGLLLALKDTHPGFQADLQAIGDRYGKPVDVVYFLWRHYCRQCFDQSALVSEFESWYKKQLAEPVVDVAKYVA